MNIDASTLAFMTSMTFATLAVAVLVQFKVNKTYRGLGWWLLGAILQAVGFLLMLALNFPAIFMASVLANPLIFLGQIFLAIGVIRFLDGKERRWVYVSLFALYAIAYSFFIVADNSILGRSIVVYLSSAAISLLTAMKLFRLKKGHFSSSANFTASIFAVYGALELVSTVISIILPPLSSYNDLFHIPSRIVPFLIPGIGSTLWTFGFIIMVNQRLNAENREEKEKLRLIFEISPDAKMITRVKDGLFVDVNTGFLAMCGYLREEVVGTSIFDLDLWCNPADRQGFLSDVSGSGFIENRETMFKRTDGSQFVGMLSGRRITLDGESHCISVITDITERKMAEETIRHMATHDVLTDLPTMRLFRDRLAMAMSLSRRNKTSAAVMFLDLDGFKAVNDGFGHGAGDALLKEIAGRLRSSVRETDTVARTGGDEFLLVITDFQSIAHVAGTAEKILASLTRPFFFNGARLSVGVSIGISLFPGDAEDIDLLIKLADDAMYKIKAAGKNAYGFSENKTPAA